MRNLLKQQLITVTDKDHGLRGSTDRQMDANKHIISSTSQSIIIICWILISARSEM